MRIKEFEYCDRRQEWQLEKIDFADLNLILFVGVSGAGKTRILQSILNLKKIAQGQSLNGVKWNIKFYSRNHELYCWMGEFETISSERILEANNNDNARYENKYKIINEILYKNEILIMERREKHIDLLQGYDRVPPISPVKSVLEVFAQDEIIAPIKEEFDRIFDSNTSLFFNARSRRLMNYRFLLNADKISLAELREYNLPIQAKLALANKFIPEVFEEIKMHFIHDIFGCVEDIKIEDVDLEKMKTRKTDNQPRISRQLSLFPDRNFLLFIKEKGVSHWISQENISSGMLKTLVHISELYLLPEDSILLIDEFENSLGVNCLDIVTKNLNIENRKIQFILTSHHPYIINNIEIKSWKIVTRKGGTIKVKNAEDLGLGRSRHDAFMQLINSEKYTEGIEIEEV